MQEIGIESSILKDIIENRKTVEARLAKDKFLDITEGSELRLREDVWRDGQIVYSKATDVSIKITKIERYKSFKDMFDSIDYSTVIPAAKNLDEALGNYSNFYTAEQENEFGVIAFTFTVLGV